MTFLRKPLISFEALCTAAWRHLDRPSVLRAFALAVPLAFGLLSVLLGQDDNWDLHNYHRYNAYALLNGKIGLDLAPAQWQSYFNPALDLIYYGLSETLPGPVAGFVMGLLHGLNFVLVLALARRLLPVGAAGAWRLPVLLALAGCLGPGFLSELGNSMGDNMTSLCVLGALLLLVARWDSLQPDKLRAARFVLPALAAGLLMGIGTGLKLTNAVYALALCVALLCVTGSLWQRVRVAFVFGIGVLAGIGASAGFWYWKMWQVFGNPLFPQFNDKFHGALAAPIGIGDTGWIPKGLGEKLLWPFIFTIHPSRVMEIPFRQLIWPMLYLLTAALAVHALRERILTPDRPARSSPQQRLLLIFFALSWLGWLNLFGIYRYLVPLELLAPLMLWLVVQALMPAPFARVLAGYALLLAAVAVVPLSTWGHARWERASFRAEVPAFAEPGQSMVFTVHGDPPMGWLVPFFPSRLAFVALGSGFPESDGYRARVDAMMASRSGPLYVMLQADRHDPREPRSAQEQGEAAARNRVVLDKAAQILRRYRIGLDEDSCKAYPAFVGTSGWAYQLCLVRRPQN